MVAARQNLCTTRRIGGFMVKAKDFWSYLCNDLDYRMFSGVVCPGLLPLYKDMTSDLMHYIPAANERIALGIVSGSYVGGFKGGILIDMKFAYDITSLLSFNIDHKIPLLVIGSGSKDSYLTYDFPRAVITTDNFKSKVDFVVKNIEKEKVPGLLVFKEGIL
jgi:hypothetical protein